MERYTVGQVAYMLQCSVGTVRNRIAAGYIPERRDAITNHRYILAADLVAYAQRAALPLRPLPTQYPKQPGRRKKESAIPLVQE